MHSVARRCASHTRGELQHGIDSADKEQDSKVLLATVGVAVIAVGAYGLGRVYPPLGETSGTIAPAERYRSSQVDANGVSLGDTEIPKLMQTDAFELMVKDPAFRALASDPGFAALAQNSVGVHRSDAQSAVVCRARRQPKIVRGRGEGRCRRQYRGSRPECSGVRGNGDQSAGLPGAWRSIRKRWRQWPIMPRRSRP